MKLNVKYIFPTLSSVANIYIYQLPEGLGMKKILAHGIGCKKIHKPGRTFFGFSQIFMELCGAKVQLSPLHGNFISGDVNTRNRILICGYHLNEINL